DADAGRDAQALGEAYDFLKRYPDSPAAGEVGLAAGALHLRRGEADRAIRFLAPLARRGAPDLRSKAVYLLGGALFSLGRDADVLRAVPDVDAASTPDRWLALAQAWRAAAYADLGRRDLSAERYRAVAASGIESPMRAYVLAAIAADWDRKGHPEAARRDLARAGAEAARWGLPDLRDALAVAAAGEFVSEKRLSDAARAYADFVRGFPDSPLVSKALYRRGLALKRLGREKDAADSFADLLKRDPDSAYAADAHLQLGQLYTDLGAPDEALAQYRAMGADSPAAGAAREALLLQAQVRYNARRFADAVPLYRRWLEGAPPGAKTREVEGLLLVCLWKSDRDDPELAALAEKIPEHPLVARIRWELAAKAYRRGDWAAAAELFARQVRADPRSPRADEARFYRAEALRQLGKSADAALAYRDLLARAPKGPRARTAALRLGGLLFQAGDYPGAAAAYARVTGTDADAADAAYDRALALAKSGRAAARAWEDFAGRFPKHPKADWAWREAARLRVRDKDFEAAARDDERVRGPGRAAALYALGRLRESLKLTARARDAYAELEGVLPKDDPSRLAGLLRLGLLWELANEPRKAAPLYADVLAHAAKGSPPFLTAAKRLQALTADKSLLGR
ncbi:MAG: tetratricopeptide repeat protein, partial [Elusimicrobia bacterium]|nr:tetratricopeptide repeat protein [Elusimicrobiota bacterium]